MTVSIVPGDIASPAAQELIAALDDHLGSLYPPEDNFLELPHEEVRDDRGTFLLALEGCRAVGCGAVRKVSGTTGEIKRMYVAPPVRGQGIGTALLQALESWARDAGIHRLVLETGDTQMDAIALYERAGFTQIPCFGPYAAAPRSRCFGKDLPGA